MLSLVRSVCTVGSVVLFFAGLVQPFGTLGQPYQLYKSHQPCRTKCTPEASIPYLISRHISSTYFGPRKRMCIHVYSMYAYIYIYKHTHVYIYTHILYNIDIYIYIHISILYLFSIYSLSIYIYTYLYLSISIYIYLYRSIFI